MIDPAHKARVANFVRQRGTRAEQIELLLELIDELSDDAPPVVLTDGRRACAECGEPFKPSRSDHELCSVRCRVRRSRSKPRVTAV